MDETGQEDTRPGSGHSDDGSEEGGFVEVTQEDAQLALQQQQKEPPAPAEEEEEEDVDLYGDGEGAAAGGGLEDEETPLSPPPSPVDQTSGEQLINFGDSSALTAETTPLKGKEGKLLVAGPPELLGTTGEFNLDEILGVSQTEQTTSTSNATIGDLLGDFGTSEGVGSGVGGSEGLGVGVGVSDRAIGGDPFGEAPGSTAADPFGIGQIEEPIVPAREPTPPPPTEPVPARELTPPPPTEPVPAREPTPPPPPPRDPTPPTPPPKDLTPPPPPPKDPTPPPPPPKDPTPPPPPPKDLTPPPPPPKESRGVEEVTPHQPPVSTAPQKGRKPKPSGYLEFLKVLHPFVLYIIYWRELKLSAVVLGVCLVVLLTLTLNTVIHTSVLLLLSFMVVSLTYIVSKVIIDSFYNKKVKNPFSMYLENDITLPEDVLMEWAAYALRRTEAEINYLIRLLLFANIKHSLAFAVCLWMASFVTNYLTLLSAMFVLVGVVFTVPWLYSQFQSQIDSHLGSTISKLGAFSKRVLSYVPMGGGGGGKKKAE